ncbi:MAG: M48 family metallopeptidase [Paludibacteraceae bacterium]|nr:M48 family metallopeptidase [Paludibacteraceae bacterium]
MIINFTIITWIIIAILILDFIVERTLHHLNAKNLSADIPEALKGIYKEDEYAKQQAYSKTNEKFSVFTSTFNLLLVLLMFVFGGFAIVNNIAESAFENTILVSLLFFGILYVADTILGIPFDAYDTFVIEEKFGFNKSTKGIFVADKIKSLLLTAVIGGLLISLIELIYNQTQDLFWILAWAVVAAFSIFLNMFYSSIIVPLFNKQTPLEEGELRDAIQDFASSVDFKLDNIYVMDSSKRSTKANAYFSGLGKKKRVVLFDTLINDLSKEEIVAVLAHEIGHYKHKHTLQMLVVSLLNTLVMLFLLGLFLGNDDLAKAFGVEKANFHINILAFGLLYTPISVVIGVLVNKFSRHNEYQADAFAAKHGLGEKLISGLKKLSVKSLSNLQPHPWYVSFYYSHPTLLQRIEAINKLKGND